MTHGAKIVGYIRVSTEEQGVSDAGLESQRRAIQDECARKGWALLRIEEDVSSGKKTNGRPGLARALEACRSGEASGLVAAKLDRITRSLVDFAKLVEDARKHNYDLVVIDQSFDLSTAHGKAMAGMLAVFAEYERDLISARTKTALAVKRSQGVKLGRPQGLTIDPDLAKRIRNMREDGMTLRAICDVLNSEGVPTPGTGRKTKSNGRDFKRIGKEWRPSSLRAILR